MIVAEDDAPVIAAASYMILAGRTAQEYNQRKNRDGAFREDPYPRYPIEADEAPASLAVYIDLNTVRSGSKVANRAVERIDEA